MSSFPPPAGRPSGPRTYLVPIILSVALVLTSPLGMLVIFLSGDSCCGENTSGTMIGVTAGIVILLALFALAVSGIVKLASRRSSGPGFRVPVATLILAGPASLLYVVFVTLLVITAF